MESKKGKGASSNIEEAQVLLVLLVANMHLVRKKSSDRNLFSRVKKSL
jgi:hypothetical protein